MSRRPKQRMPKLPGRSAITDNLALAAPVLLIDGLRHGYGGKLVLDGFSLRQTAGRHLLLLGPSGSGKTTLINAVAGLITPDGGRIEIAGEAMTGTAATRRDDLRRRRIGIVFQTLRLVSALTLRGNLQLARRLSGEPADAGAIDALLASVGLGHRADAKPRALSQGEIQRAAIARALVGQPALLIADEPTSALDDDNAARVARLLLDTTAANGSTLLIATHDARLKAYIPDRVELAAPLRVAA